MLRRKGLKHLSRGNYQEAISSFQQLLELDPQEQTKRYLGVAYMGAGQYEESETQLKGILEEYGEHYPRLRSLGDLYYVWGKRKSAGKYYRKALEDAEGKVEKLLEKRISNTESEEAFQAVREAEQAYRDGTAAFREGNLQEAIERFEEATRLDPTYVLAWNNLGAILLNYFKKYDEAEEAFRTAMEYEPLQIVQGNLQKLTVAKKIANRKGRVHLFRR